MRINTIIILLLMFSLKGLSQNYELPERLKGIEIYLIKGKYSNKNSLRKYNEKKLKRFSKKIKSLSEIPDSICNNYIDCDKVSVKSKPFLNQFDIDYYLWKDFILVLKESGLKKLNELEKKVHGVPFVIVVNKKPLLGGWFWNRTSSTVCDRVFILSDDNLKEIKIDFKLCGKDPRNNERLMLELKKVNE